MADELKQWDGTLTTSETTVYTVPTGKCLIIQGFWVSNANSEDKYFTLKLNDKRLAPQTDAPAHDAIINSGLEIPIYAEQTIKILGEVADDMDYSIWGIEVDV